MSYRLITKAILTVKPIAGESVSGEVTLRAYAAPKSPAKGSLTLDGVATDYKRTGGRGRGLVSHTYLYVTYKNESTFFEITEAMDKALVGGTATLTTVTTVTTDAKPKQAEPAAEESEAKSAKAPRRVKAKA